MGCIFLTSLIIQSTIICAYLGSAAANNTWKPWLWDFKKGSTWLGIIGGSLAGGLAPIGYASSVGTLLIWGFNSELAIIVTFGFGMVGTYLGMAATNNSWNLLQWNFIEADLWNRGVQVFIFGSIVVGYIGAWYICYKFFVESVVKLSFILSSIIGSISLGYLSGASVNITFNFANWKFTPNTLLCVIGGVVCGFMIPLRVISSIHFINYSDMAKAIVFVSIFGTPYLITSAANGSFTRWNMSLPKTYESIVGGVLLGMSLPGFFRSFKELILMTQEMWNEMQELFSSTKYTKVAYRGVTSSVAQEYISNYGKVNLKPILQGLSEGGQLGTGIYATNDINLAVDYAKGRALDDARIAGFFKTEFSIMEEVQIIEQKSFRAEKLTEAEASKLKIWKDFIYNFYMNGVWKEHGQVMDVYVREFNQMKGIYYLENIQGIINPQVILALEPHDFISAPHENTSSQFKFRLDSKVFEKLRIIPHEASLNDYFRSALDVSANKLLNKFKYENLLPLWMLSYSNIKTKKINSNDFFIEYKQ